MDESVIERMALECGFQLAGVAPSGTVGDWARFSEWIDSGRHGAMAYLADHRKRLRAAPSNLLSSARSVICVGKLYNAPRPYSTTHSEATQGWISRYAWGVDYHLVMRDGLSLLAQKLAEHFGPFEYRICVDTAPVLERSLARLAGLGWIGRNTCLINQFQGSWFFLGELVTSLELAPSTPPPDRCGTCRRCIDACPTNAIVPDGSGGWTVDARLCISYITIEKRGSHNDDERAMAGNHVFGCDICQDVCPWNRRASVTNVFDPVDDMLESPDLERLAAVTEDEFRLLFLPTPLERARYRGFLRNVATAMGNSGLDRFRPALNRLAAHEDAAVSGAAHWALQQLD